MGPYHSCGMIKGIIPHPSPAHIILWVWYEPISSLISSLGSDMSKSTCTCVPVGALTNNIFPPFESRAVVLLSQDALTYLFLGAGWSISIIKTSTSACVIFIFLINSTRQLPDMTDKALESWLQLVSDSEQSLNISKQKVKIIPLTHIPILTF